MAVGCEETRLNYAALHDELMKGSSPAFDEAATNASSIEEYAEAAKRYADDLTNCGFRRKPYTPNPNPNPNLTLTLTLTLTLAASAACSSSSSTSSSAPPRSSVPVAARA